MPPATTLHPSEIRSQITDNPKMRTRDLADQLGIAEAALVAAQRATPINANPDALIPALKAVGPVMALTRNISAVHEKIGVYDNYQGGAHAAMVLSGAIDLRIFARHWVHGFATGPDTGSGQRHALQIFDVAGDAVHKIFARPDTDMAAWARLITALDTGVRTDHVPLEPRSPVDPAQTNPGKLTILRDEWAKMTDTHQFLRLTAKLRMNRLGAYRTVGAPFAKPLAPWALRDAITALAGTGIDVMVFVGNRGCIQIHTGPLDQVKPMGPWQNVMDPAFNLHLRTDHVAEVWAVDKPTKRGPAASIEAFDKQGALILQMFGRRKEDDTNDTTAAFRAIRDALPTLHAEEV